MRSSCLSYVLVVVDDEDVLGAKRLDTTPAQTDARTSACFIVEFIALNESCVAVGGGGGVKAMLGRRLYEVNFKLEDYCLLSRRRHCVI